MSVYSTNTEVISKLGLRFGKVILAIHKPIQVVLLETAQNTLLTKIDLVEGVLHHSEDYREHLLSEVEKALIQNRIISRADLQKSMASPRRLISTPDGMFVIIFLKINVEVDGRAMYWKG